LAAGFAFRAAASSSLSCANHSSSCSIGRAFSEGKEPITPALHWARTRSGLEMMKSGDPITGIESWFAREAGIAMESPAAWSAGRLPPELTIPALTRPAMRGKSPQTLDAAPSECLMAAHLD